MASLIGTEINSLPQNDVAQRPRNQLVPLPEACAYGWAQLAEQAVEPNGFFSPGFLLPLCAHAAKAQGPRMLQSFGPHGELTGQIPVIGALRRLQLPIPAAVSLFPYVTLGTPLISDADPVETAGALIDTAAEHDIAMIGLPMVALDGPVAAAFREALSRRGLEPAIRNAHRRAALAVPQDAEAYLRAGLGSKKLKELRRQRHRLEELGTVAWTVSRDPREVALALQRFLSLEAKGWKGEQRSSLGHDPRDRAFISRAARLLAESGKIEICELTLNAAPVAAGIVLSSGRSALFFKIAYDEAYARYSPGVQLTVALTRHFAEGGTIDFVDSTAAPGHPMIDHVWRERIAIGDLFIPTAAGPLPRLCLAAFDARSRIRQAVKSLYLKIGGGRRPRSQEKV